jgi:hypothetical protein
MEILEPGRFRVAMIADTAMAVNDGRHSAKETL